VGEHWGASALPLRPLAAATVVRSGGAVVERARRQWRQRKTKRACEREGANVMVRWGGDREVTHAQVCACTLMCVHCGTGGARQGPWQRARLRNGWRAKTTTTWLDGAATLECSGGEATGRQDNRDGMAASMLSDVEVGHDSSTRQRREERRLMSGPGVLFKI
jgi:hypothetical protein